VFRDSNAPSRRRFHRALQAFVALGTLALVSGCDTSSVGFPGFGSRGPVTPTGDILGSGTVRVALLLPKSAPGNAGEIAAVFRNSAELALRDFQDADVQILIKDTGGTPGGARAAAQSALSEGAELILGPLFSQSVAAVGGLARSAGRPVVAFSTDTSVASSGVYLMSFLPQENIKRIITFASKRGKRSFAALLPDNGYGNVVEATFRQTVARLGGRVVGLERYSTDRRDMQAKAEALAAAARHADAVLIPDAGHATPFLVQILATKGITRRKVQFLGGGQWEDPRITGEPALNGAWYAAASKAGYASFAARYQSAFGTVPPRKATLAYDAVLLAAGLVKKAGVRRFSNEILTSRDGYKLVDGIFRFLPDGTNQRGLAVFEVVNGATRVISPAPATFQSGS